MRRRSKRFKEISKNIDKNKKLDLQNIFEKLISNCTSKFDESIDVSLKINLKQSKGGDFNLRTTMKLPNGNGKKYIAVLCEQDKVEDAKKVERIFSVLRIC